MPGTRLGVAWWAVAVVAMGVSPLRAREDVAPEGGETARVIVRFKAGSSLVEARSLSPRRAAEARAGALGARLRLPMSAGPVVSALAQVVLASGVTSTDLAQQLAGQGDVEYAVPDERRRIVRYPERSSLRGRRGRQRPGRGPVVPACPGG